MLRSWLFAQCDGFQYLIILAMISRRSETQLVQRTKFVLHVELVFQRFVVQQFWICLPVLSRITPLMPISRRSHLVIWDAYPCNLECHCLGLLSEKLRGLWACLQCSLAATGEPKHIRIRNSLRTGQQKQSSVRRPCYHLGCWELTVRACIKMS